MGDIIKLAVRLFIFSLIAAIGLAVTNEVTKGPIAEQKLAAQKEALNKVLPGCKYEEIVEIEGLAEDSQIAQMFVGTDEATGEKTRSDLRIPLLCEYISICKKYEKIA